QAWFETVIDRQARLIAQWMHISFIHGVMNTDNMSVAGETIDYGPCAFMDHYAHDRVYSSIDRHGRYAYNNQPTIGLWNLTRLAETIVPLLAADMEAGIDIAKTALERYRDSYEGYWLTGMRAKTGLATAQDEDRILIEELLDAMAASRADFTLTFHYLSQLQLDSTRHDSRVRTLFKHAEHFDAWAAKWRARLRQENSVDATRQTTMQAVNPVYIPRNHQIEAAIRAAEDHDDFSVFHRLHEVLQDPWQRQTGKETYLLPPEPHEVVQQTFCGT
ncbi:MAG: protein adenylyltransferase SelO family protein, partial [Thiohalobacterales bacterium]|nr:protein adenylyltransferase SelO family protein [Thiohalobacterales bacterium]